MIFSTIHNSVAHKPTNQFNQPQLEVNKKEYLRSFHHLNKFVQWLVIEPIMAGSK